MGKDIKHEKRNKNYTVPLSDTKLSDLCGIFVLSIRKNSLSEPFYDEQNGTGKNLRRTSELYGSAQLRILPEQFESDTDLCGHRSIWRNASWTYRSSSL